MISITSLVNFYRRKMTLPIRSHDIVLDVGSGGKPHPRANVLCERFLNSTRDRTGLVFDRRGKDAVIGDIYALPFNAGAFDYVICCHVAEHLTDPASAMRELQRVGRAGYIEAPSELIEALMDNPAHESVVRVEEGKLLFQRKSPLLDCVAIKPYVQRLARRRAWQRLISHDEFFVRYVWRDRVQFEIVGGEDAYDDCVHTGDVEAGREQRSEPWARRALRRYLLHAVGAVVYPNRAQYVLSELLCCPACHGDLYLKHDAITCVACSASYSYELDGTPRLLIPEQAGTGVRVGASAPGN